MPFGQLLTSLSAMNGVLGNPVRESLDIPDTLYSGNPIINFFNWALNLTTDGGTKENSKQNLGEVETTTTQYNSSTPNYPENHNADSVAIMWYLASFGTLVMFFLLISFSEVCCKKSLTMPADEPEMAPPPYDLFAPPPYDTLYDRKKEKNSKRKKKRKCEVFVINVFGDKNSSRVPPSETVQRDDSGREIR